MLKPLIIGAILLSTMIVVPLIYFLLKKDIEKKLEQGIEPKTSMTQICIILAMVVISDVAAMIFIALYVDI
jgi:hypothetical protein